MAIKYADGRTEYAGRVVGFSKSMHFSTPGMGDNTEFAVVLDLNDGWKSVPVSTYHDGLYDLHAEAQVDATPEIAKQYADKLAYESAMVHELKTQRDAEQEAVTVRKDKRIRVISGRAITPGTEGVCFWAGKTKYGVRVGFTTDAGHELWTNIVNVKVISE